MQKRLKTRLAWPLGALLAVCVAGCATDDLAKRTESRDTVVENRRKDTAEFFATNSAPLTLRQAVGIARTRTLKLTEASLEASLANIQKGVAFSAFLPRLNASYMYSHSDVDLQSTPVIAGKGLTLGDHVETAQLALTQPLFVPNAWLMFFEARHLEQAQKYKLERARQLLDVQVTAQFYESAVADALIRSYEAETNSTAALEQQVAGLLDEGMATKPDLARVRTKFKNDCFQLKKARDRAELSRANLADILRFMPGAPEVRADGDSMLEVLKDPRVISLEDATMEALTNRLDLFACDQVTKVREIEIYRALTEWLPEVAATGAGSTIDQQLIQNSSYWSGGLVGTLSLFKGFQSVNDYRKAKVERQAEYELLENRMMTVVVAVIDAYRNRERAEEGAEVARSALESCRMDYESSKNRYDEGRETFSDLMDKISALEAAKVRASSAEYARALAEIVFRNTLGENLK